MDFESVRMLPKRNFAVFPFCQKSHEVRLISSEKKNRNRQLLVVPVHAYLCSLIFS